MKLKKIIPENVDPVKLADEIKGDLTSELIKRMKKIESKSHQDQQSEEMAG